MEDPIVTFSSDELIDDANNILSLWDISGVTPIKAYAIVNYLKHTLETKFGIEKVSETTSREDLH